MQDESGESPSLQQLGEFAVIDRLVRGREQPAAVVLGPGDDAALVSSGDGRALVSTDMLVQDRHFRLDWSTPHDIGRKAIAQNAADIEAMGGRPTAFVVAFGAPGDTPAAKLDALVNGMWDEAQRIGAGIAGVGNGIADVLIGWRGQWIAAVEIKDGSKPPSARKLTPAQVLLHGEIRRAGLPLHVVTNETEALALLGARVGA